MLNMENMQIGSWHYICTQVPCIIEETTPLNGKDAARDNRVDIECVSAFGKRGSEAGVCAVRLGCQHWKGGFQQWKGALEWGSSGASSAGRGPQKLLEACNKGVLAGPEQFCVLKCSARAG